jgi:hypothetical protein
VLNERIAHRWPVKTNSEIDALWSCQQSGAHARGEVAQLRVPIERLAREITNRFNRI